MTKTFGRPVGYSNHGQAAEGGASGVPPSPAAFFDDENLRPNDVVSITLRASVTLTAITEAGETTTVVLDVSEERTTEVLSALIPDLTRYDGELPLGRTLHRREIRAADGARRITFEGADA